jgi:oxygen-independent coproporphyrinogen-3 oxidase
VLDEFFSRRGFIRCVDVMIGIPHQKPENVVDELTLLDSYCPEHLSIYLLTVEEGTPLGKRFKPDEKFNGDQRDCMEAAMRYLTRAGYIHYEISNFAKPGFESRHNMKYWTFQPYIGLGPQSHSFYRGSRYCVDMSVDSYFTADSVNLKLDHRKKNDEAVEYIFTGLRMMQGLSVEKMKHDIDFDFPGVLLKKIESLNKKGLIRILTRGNDTFIRLSREGIFLSNAVIYDLVEDLL